MRNISLFITILAAIVLTIGCGKGKLATINVTGKVTYEGEPLADAAVRFSPKGAEGNAAYGTTDANGFYKLQTLLGEANAGTTPGEYLVTISKREQLERADEDGRNDGPSKPSTAPSGPTPMPKSFIPERYESTTTSNLTATVSKESKEHNFDLVK